MSKKNPFQHRDVSYLLQKFREFLFGRKPIDWDARFPSLMAPRSIPPPDIPRGPIDKYSNLYYYKRNCLQSVKPPAVAPIAEGPNPGHDPTQKIVAGGLKPETICFSSLPMPGEPWWWDGHHYYEITPDDTEKPPTPPAAPLPVAKKC